MVEVDDYLDAMTPLIIGAFKDGKTFDVISKEYFVTIETIRLALLHHIEIIEADLDGFVNGSL